MTKRNLRNQADRYLRRRAVSVNVREVHGGTVAGEIGELHIHESDAYSDYEDGHDDPASELISAKVSRVQKRAVASVCMEEGTSTSEIIRNALHLLLLYRMDAVKLVAYAPEVKNFLRRLP